MKKRFDSVQMMRDIRDELGKRYSDFDVEQRELREIRRKYSIKA